MHTAKPRMVVPYGLKTLLEGVSRAVLKASPSNITEFAAVYFRELIIFREEHPELDIKDLVREFHMTRVEGWAEGTTGATQVPRGKRADVGDAFRPDATTPISDEPKRKEKSTDTEEDQINEEPCREQSTKTTQYPSTVDEFVVDKAGDEKGAGLAYVPADPAQLAAQMLGNIELVASEPELKDAAVSVQTLPTSSHSVEKVDDAAPALASAPSPAPTEAAAAEEEAPAPTEAEPASAPAEAEPAPAEAEPALAEVAPAASAHSLRVGSATHSQTSIPGEVVTSGSQAEQPPADIIDPASSAPLQEEQPPPPPPPPPDIDPLQAESCSSEIELTSDIQITPMCDDDPDAGGEPQPPPYVEQFPQQIVIPFVDTVACLLDPLMASLNAGQFASILDPSADDAECDPDRMDTTEELRSADPGFIMSAMATSEPGQPPPYSNVWTLYCLTDMNQQGRKSPPPPLPPVGTGAPVPQATLFISSGKDQPQYLQPQMIQQGQPPQVSSPTYVMMEDGKKGNAPPFILVGSSVQNKQDWKPIPGHAVLAQPDAGGTVRRFATIPVPVARAADPKMANPNFNSAQDSGRPPTPVFLSVAIPLEDVMTGKKGSGAGDKAPFAGSYGIAGEITFTTASVRRTE
ncbi:calcium-binding tyrosine phosphorylation-regulated protein isoform X2 [Rhineura floridana]|nr:calcium-binding tyrosine phosphorylation-regulated protein isoform X2 [Rhineura floridana]XP_061453016.1 calcium-binding tyrosine phosphorylation-regulated protein isoform X2 [Rhineura floridana]XP_061453022.1 calcium-binding tyrosine phosphorylation-regulated protein isoform X2 [Rhineura floridana]XP_061453031.1 calcium-binding tyrosine phosphorylation-regulated protein isoform X2 [Rhineura floridana]